MLFFRYSIKFAYFSNIKILTAVLFVGAVAAIIVVVTDSRLRDTLSITTSGFVGLTG